MAFLHKGDLKPTTIFTFYPCVRDAVYLEGLKEGESITSIQPFFYQNANGYLAIDDRFVSLQITRNDQVIKTMDLSWNTQCSSQTQTIQKNIAYPVYYHYGFGAMMVLSAGMVTILIARRFFREKQ